MTAPGDSDPSPDRSRGIAHGATAPAPAWELYSVVVATVVGLLSLSVSAYTAYMLHVQTRAQVFPYLQVVTIGEHARVAVHNKGVGPAFVKSVRVEVGGVPVTTWKEFFAANHIDLHGSTLSSTVSRAAIAANESLTVLQFDDRADFLKYAQVDLDRIRVDLCYCSVLDECWVIRNAASAPAPVKVCKIDPHGDFTD